MKIAVIGAGVGGLVALYTVKRRLPTTDLELVAFEQAEEIGGQWVFTEAGQEKYEEGLPISTSIYKGLKANSPYPLMEFHSDHPFPSNTRTFPTWDEFLGHIQQFAFKFDLMKYVKFSTMVTKICRDPVSGNVQLEVKDLKTRQKANYIFDSVFICCGQERLPFIPAEVDTSVFTGTVLHYHDLKDPARLYGKRILVVGSSYGALDMVVFLAKRVSKLYVSYHKHKPFWFTGGTKWSTVCDLRPMISQAIGKTAYFVDGSSADVDVVIYATGFRQFHPLSDELALDFNKSPSLFPLYKNVVHPGFPRLFFLGKAAELILLLLRYQAEFACSIIDGNFLLPVANEMKAEINMFHNKWKPQLDLMYNGDITKNYPTVELEFELAAFFASTCGLPKISLNQLNLFYKTIQLVKEDTLNFKNYELVDPKLVDSNTSNHHYFLSLEE